MKLVKDMNKKERKAYYKTKRGKVINILID